MVDVDSVGDLVGQCLSYAQRKTSHERCRQREVGRELAVIREMKAAVSSPDGISAHPVIQIYLRATRPGTCSWSTSSPEGHGKRTPAESESWPTGGARRS